jgi:hypothetical protein
MERCIKSEELLLLAESYAVNERCAVCPIQSEKRFSGVVISSWWQIRMYGWKVDWLVFGKGGQVAGWESQAMRICH